MGMKIAFFGVDKDKQSIFADALKGQDVTFFDGVLDRENTSLAKDAEAICLFVNSTLDKNTIDALPKLKFVATRSTGYDHIDVAYAKEKGIQIANVPGYGAHTVAEFAFGLMLNLSRKILSANSFMRQSQNMSQTVLMQGFELCGKTLGVVGAGRIGKTAIKIAKGFGMEVLACDPHPDEAFAKEQGFEYKSLNEVLRNSDIVTLHAPYAKENHHLINKENIYLMKKGAYLVNTARGELLDTKALVVALKEGIIAGAGLDVLEAEKELKREEAGSNEICELNRELMQMGNVIVTPHIAFYTREAVAEIYKTTLQNILAFTVGAPVNIVQI